jgi:Uma2 family endonuclease
MSVTRKHDLISVGDYLVSEVASPFKREYVDGRVYPRGDMCAGHCRVAGNILGSVYRRLRGSPCHVFTSDMKIRVVKPPMTRLYYPDVSVVCRSNPGDSYFQDRPVAVFEVVSENTRRIDEGEKTDAYLTIPSLAVLALVEWEMPALVAYHRTSAGFVREVYDGLGAVLPLHEIDTELPVAEIYEGIDFAPEPESDW